MAKLRPMTSAALAILSLATAMTALAKPPATAPVQVMIGGQPDGDACGTYARIKGRAYGPGPKVAVRDAPGGRIVAHLHPGQGIMVCEERAAWLGIVHGEKDATMCGVTSPVIRRTAYRGPCGAGWIERRAVRDMAG